MLLAGLRHRVGQLAAVTERPTHERDPADGISLVVARALSERPHSHFHTPEGVERGLFEGPHAGGRTKTVGQGRMELDSEPATSANHVQGVQVSRIPALSA